MIVIAIRRVAILLATTAITVHGMHAQSVVRGTIFDSLVTHRWLAGAAVTIPEIHRTVTTDNRGRFLFGPVPAGRYSITFQHPALDALDLPHVALLLSVPDTGAIDARLAMPSASSYIYSLCRAGEDGNPGVIVGSVRDVDDSLPLRNALIVASWTEVVVDPEAAPNGRIDRRTFQRESRSDADGHYISCGVSVQFPIFVRASIPGHETAEAIVPVDSFSVAHRSFAIGRDAHATARVIGVIKDIKGNPIARASVGLRGLGGRARTDSLGRFSLRNVPTGTQFLEARVLGANPRFTEVAFRSDGEHIVQIDFPVDRVREAVPAAVATIDDVRHDPTGFEMRRRTLKGTFLTAAQIESKPDATFAEILLRLPHMATRKFIGATIVMLKSDEEEALPGDSTTTVSGCTPSYWLDELPMRSPLPGGPFPELQRQLNARNIRGIEFYEGRQIPAFFPPPSRGRSACAVIVIWTKTPG